MRPWLQAPRPTRGGARRLCACSRPTGRVPPAEGALYEEQEVGVRSPHHPRIVHRPDGPWVVECRQCRDDNSASMPIGIGLPLADRLTAERLVENHAGPAGRTGGGR
jgi:hypothetical protein